jgi:hypothetical protein
MANASSDSLVNQEVPMPRFKMPLLLVGAVGLALMVYGLSIPQAHSASGRDFAGFYSLTDVTLSGQNYTLTFTARVFNYSGADVSGATFLLRNCPSSRAECSSFANINLDTKRPLHLSTKIAIPAALYAHWQHGGRPELVIEFTAADGEQRSERVELMLDHGGALARAN